MTNHTEVAKRFAHGCTCLKASHFYIEDGILWSYGSHFPVAMWVDFPKVVLWNKDGYSVSTGKHQSHARHEIVGSFARDWLAPGRQEKNPRHTRSK